MSPVRPRLASAGLLAVTLLGCLASAGRPPIGARVTDDVRAARIALGPVDDVLVPAADPRPRLRALRAAADQLGNSDEALDAATAVVRLSRQRRALAAVTGDNVVAATAELAADLDAAVALAERLQASWTLSQVLDGPDDGHGAALFGIVARGGWLDDDDLETARDVATTPTQRALIERVSRVPRMDLDAIAALGPSFLDLLERHLTTAVAHDELDGAVRAARAIVAIDPLHVDARLVLAYAADVGARRLEPSPAVLQALLGSPDEVRWARYAMAPAQAVAVLEHARREAPRAASLALGAAWALARARLPGDAWSRLGAATPGDPTLIALRDDLRAMLALDAGALATYRTWRAARGGLASPSVAARELTYLWIDAAPAQQALAGEAAARAVAAAWPSARTWGVATRVAGDARAPRALRAQARALIDDPDQRAVLSYCESARLPELGCSALLDDLGEYDEDEPEDIATSVPRLAAVPGIAARWLRAARWASVDDLRAIGDHVLALEGTAPALTELWVAVAMQVAVARGDVALVHRLRAAYGGLLAPLGQVGVTLALTDLAAGVDVDAVGSGLASMLLRSWPVVVKPHDGPVADEDLHVFDDAADDSSGDDDAELADDGPVGETALLASVIEKVAAGDAPSLSTLVALRQRHPDGSAPLDVVIAVAQAAAGDVAAAQRALPADAPERDLVAAMLDHADLAATRAALGRYLSRRSTQAWGQGWPQLAFSVAHLAAGGPPRALRGMVDATAVDDVARALARGDAPWALISAAHPFDRGVAWSGLLARQTAVADAAPDEVQPRAAAALAEARAAAIGGRSTLAWLALIAGDTAAAASVATAPAGSGPGLDSEPLDASHPVRRLLAGRADLPDDLVRDLWRLLERPAAGGDRGAIVGRLLAAAGPADRGAGAAAVACRILVDADQADHAIAPCWSAWRRGIVDDDLAVALTWLVLSRPDETAVQHIDGAALAAQITTQLDASSTAAVWNNLAVWYERRGDLARHAWAAERADRAGADRHDETIYYAAMAGPRAPTLRAIVAEREGEHGRDRFELGQFAFAAGDLAAARWYVAAAAARDHGPEDRRLQEETFADVLELASHDVANGRLSADAAGAWYRAFLDSQPVADLVTAFPDAALSQLARARTTGDAGGVAAATTLLAAFPDNRLVVMHATNRLASTGQHAAATAALARARAAHPESALLSDLALVDGPARDRWLADGDSFGAALAAVTPAEVAALAPHREVVGAAEAFLPQRVTGGGGHYDLASGGRIVVLELANPTRCAARDCLDAQLTGFDADWHERWRRDATIGGARGREVLLDAPMGTFLVTLVPSGGRAFELIALIPSEATGAAAMRAALRLLRDTVRPLDLVVPDDRAAALRAAVTMPADAVRVAARRGLGAAGCAWLPDGLDAATRAAVLVDVALLEPALVARAVGCARVGAAVAPLAAIALSSDDATVASFGRAVAAAHPAAVVDAARILLAPGHGQASRPMAGDEERPRRAWLELAAALPAAGRERAVDLLLASTESADRAAGILVAGLLPTPVTRARLRDEITLAPAGFALLAIDALPEPLEPADLAALRQRADQAPWLLEPPLRRLLRRIAAALRDHADPADHDRLTRLASRLRTTDTPLPPPPAPAPTLAHVALTDDELRRAPLPRLLDGKDWAFARMPKPAELFATSQDLLARLRITGATEQYVLGALRDRARGPLALLASDGGLDLARPIECAARDHAWVCTATVADPAALDRVLAAFPEALPGIQLPQLAAVGGAALGMLAGAAPLVAERALAEPKPDAKDAKDAKDDDDDELGLFGLGPRTGRRVLHERVRLTSTVAGRTLNRHLVVSASDDGRSELAGPGTVIVGDRLFVFSTQALAERVLTDLPASGAALADDAAFRAATADWLDVAAVQAYLVDSDDHDGGSTFELAPEAAGIRFRSRAQHPRHPLLPARGAALLPPGAAATVAVSGLNEGSTAEVLTALGDQRWIFDTDRDVAYGWYPAKDDVEEGWVATVGWDAALARRLASHGFARLGASAVRHAGDLHAARVGGYLVIGNREALVRAALARRPGPGDRIWISRLDGATLAASLRRRPALPGDRAAIPMFLGLSAEVLGRVESAGRRVGGADVIEGVLRPPLDPPGEDTRAVVDRWLSTPQLRNATRLPRVLAAAEVEQPLAFTFEVASADGVAGRLFPDTARTKVSVLDDRHVQVVVTPAPALDAAIAAAPLDDRARGAALADSPTVRRDHARIRQLAHDLVPAGTAAPAAALRVNAWVHDHVSYQVTAAGGDAVAILERGTGDCTEYSLLTVAVLRAAGVPAELRFGVAAGDGELVAHAWVAFHDGTAWREIDPTWGRTSVGADHIETSVLDFVALVSLDKLTIAAVTTLAP